MLRVNDWQQVSREDDCIGCLLPACQRAAPKATLPFVHDGVAYLPYVPVLARILLVVSCVWLDDSTRRFIPTATHDKSGSSFLLDECVNLNRLLQDSGHRAARQPPPPPHDTHTPHARPRCHTSEASRTEANHEATAHEHRSCHGPRAKPRARYRTTGFAHIF